jgi:hypothetical protein
MIGNLVVDRLCVLAASVAVTAERVAAGRPAIPKTPVVLLGEESPQNQFRWAKWCVSDEKLRGAFVSSDSF